MVTFEMPLPIAFKLIIYPGFNLQLILIVHLDEN
jgi:hypothetical protein